MSDQMNETLVHINSTQALFPISGLESSVGNTPLLPLRRITADLSSRVQVFAKAEWFNPGGSIKDRPALNILRSAIADGSLTPEKRLLDSTSGGSFDEFDFWTGTFSLVVFALLETVIFAYVFGIDKGWNESTTGADIVVPRIFKIFIKYITPLFIIVIFVGSVIKPSTDWISAISSLFSGNGWPFASIV